MQFAFQVRQGFAVNYRVICIAQIYNEVRKGNLERFVKHIVPVVDALVVYDDASTDGSYDYVLRHTPHLIRGLRNDFPNEIDHKQRLLEYALTLSPDFILWLDGDEVLARDAQKGVQALCEYCIENDLDGISFHELNLWRSHSWRRVDNAYDDGWFVRLWRVTPGIRFSQVEPGLHRQQFPSNIENMERIHDAQVIHYGFASERSLAEKYQMYRAHGQSGWALERLLDETTLKLEKVPPHAFPEGLYVDDEPPARRSFEKALKSVEAYGHGFCRPAVSIVCLIYRSVEWLTFVYEQVLKYTDMGQKEFFFVANDATDDVLEHLHSHYIPHRVWNNTAEQRGQWYINNVYRAFNYGAGLARGDYLLFINSDMAFSPGWFERLFEKLNGHNCVTSRLVESGKLPSGGYGISRSFGRSVEDYHEEGFLQYAESVSQPIVRDGGLFMPLLIRQDDFWRIGGYPEGNIVPDSDLFSPCIAKQGEACITGDAALMQKLQTIGIRHQTAFDSIVYHFQCGEPDHAPSEARPQTCPSVIVCNDYLTGSMGEKTMWGFLLDGLPNSAGVDMTTVGTEGDFAKNARYYVDRCYPQCAVVIQNATFIDTVDQDRFTIAYLQDNLRKMGRPSEQQERNLRNADILVTNSRLTAQSYPEFEFEIIPIGVNTTLFKPMDKATLRRQSGLPDRKIGVFVGDFSEVKGWPQIQALVEKRNDMFWILVSKDAATHEANNCRTYNRIHQSLLARLLNCADFFIIGSAVETQCLAAVEACMCNVPVVMRNTGIFSDLTGEERARVGIFGDDFEQAIDVIFMRSFSPREVMIEKALTIEGMIGHWVKVLQQAHLAVASEKLRGKKVDYAMGQSTPVHRGSRLRDLYFFFVPRMLKKFARAARKKQLRREGWYHLRSLARTILPNRAYSGLRSIWRAVRPMKR